MKRHKTTYPGVFYREVDRIGGNGLDRAYYIIFKKDGKVFEKTVGRQYADDMTPARAARIRAERIENRRKSPKKIRAAKAATKWTVGRLWQEYVHDKPPTHSWRQNGYRFANYLQATFGAKEPKQISQQDRVLSALKEKGLWPSGKEPGRIPQRKKELVATYGYKDAAGDLLFEVCRFRNPDGSKTFSQRRPIPGGGSILAIRAGEYQSFYNSDSVSV